MFRSIMFRLLRGAAAGVGAGFVMTLAAFLLGQALLAVNLLTEDQWEWWVYAIFFGGALVTAYVMPIVGALVALASMLKRAAP